jgi:hypothetical protein
MAMRNSCNIPSSASNDNSSLNGLICQLHILYAEGPSPAAVVAPACLQTGEFDQIAARISAAVKLNCGQKAVILAHSMGGNVMLHLMRQPRFEEWRYVGGLPNCGVWLLPLGHVAALHLLQSAVQLVQGRPAFVNIACRCVNDQFSCGCCCRMQTSTCHPPPPFQPFLQDLQSI